MILLPKRRSRSETRNSQSEEGGAGSSGVGHHERKRLGKIESSNPLNIQVPHMEAFGGGGSLGKRRTSAEMISEAKTFLSDVGGSRAGHGSLGSGSGSGSGSLSHIAAQQQPHQPPASVVGGVRLVSTRRPVTPRETGRVLYGKVALAGRPPSSFSMRYLRNVDHPPPRSPNLEPIASVREEPTSPEHSSVLNTSSLQALATHSRNASFDEKVSQLSKSLDPRFSVSRAADGSTNATLASKNVPANKLMPRKLPALEVRGNAVPSPKGQDNFKDNEQRERAKTAYAEQSHHPLSMEMVVPSGGGGGITLIGEKAENNRAINLLATRKIQTRSNDLLGQSSTEKLIEMLKEHAGLKECTDETVNHINSILSELYNRARKNEKHVKKGFILGGLYGLVECSSPKILLAVARVVLALRVSGSNLTGACKLIFKVARNEQNDGLFHESDLLELLIDGLGRASPLEDPEACIYGYGSIRFLTCSTTQERAELTALKDINRNWPPEHLELPQKPNTAPNMGEKGWKMPQDKAHMAYIQKLSKQDALVLRLSRHGAVQLMVLHLQILNESGANAKLTGPPLHSLYQLSAALRALADVRQISSSFERLDNSIANYCNNNNIQLELACPHLIKAAEVNLGEVEVQANIVRTLSVLSEDPNCCHIMEKFAARIGMLLGPCCANHDSQNAEKLLSLISRLGYILGNIMAKYDQARLQFFNNDVAMEYLLTVLENYSKEPLTLHNSLGDTVLDVLIKMIRVVANMSVNSEVGYGLGNTRALGSLLMEILKVTQQLTSMKMQQELLELSHATLGALHNLCFYQDQLAPPPPPPAAGQIAAGSLQCLVPELATQLCGVLRGSRDDTTQVEAARVLGNLTRNEQARQHFCKANGLQLLLQILNNPLCEKIYDLKACTVGILVNLLGDMENRLPLLQLEGAEVLLRLLRDSLQRQQDYFMGTIITQAFWNLFIDAPHLEEICSEAILDELSDLLAEHLDEERALRNSQTTHQLIWDDFAVVAADLLERLQSNYEQQSDGLFSLDASDMENDEDDVYIEGMK